MKIGFDDGSFLQIEEQDGSLILIQCAKKDRKVSMSSVRLAKNQVQQLAEFLNNWMERE